MKEHPECVHIYHTIPTDGYFGVDLRLSCPEEEQLNLTSAMKPLLDGVVCAFHCPDATLHIRAEQVAARLGISPSLLLDSTYDVLGPNDFVQPYRNGAKWNPRDDLCAQIHISLERNSHGLHLFSGRIYELL